MTEWPKISIITPSFNQGAFIEETIQSVLSQEYPNLEYMIVDGGSTDDTLDILHKYQDQLTWISEPDRGQVDAINKGLKLASGEVLAYLNSDDLYLPGALRKVGAYFAEHPQAEWLTGYCRNVDGEGQPIRGLIRAYKNFWLSRPSYRVLLVLNYIAQARRIFVPRKRTETNKGLPQSSPFLISSKTLLIALLSAMAKASVCDPPSMWSVRSRLAKRDMASLATDRY
jgi:glycosyltransferase involved in cell wall biosynthesis